MLPQKQASGAHEKQNQKQNKKQNQKHPKSENIVKTHVFLNSNKWRLK